MAGKSIMYGWTRSVSLILLLPAQKHVLMRDKYETCLQKDLDEVQNRAMHAEFEATYRYGHILEAQDNILREREARLGVTLPKTRVQAIKAVPEERRLEAVIAERLLYSEHALLHSVAVFRN
jgi:hypothetical protein